MVKLRGGMPGGMKPVLLAGSPHISAHRTGVGGGPLCLLSGSVIAAALGEHVCCRMMCCGCICLQRHAMSSGSWLSTKQAAGWMHKLR